MPVESTNEAVYSGDMCRDVTSRGELTLRPSGATSGSGPPPPDHAQLTSYQHGTV